MAIESKSPYNCEPLEIQKQENVSRFRRISPQVIATTVVNMLTIDAGLIFALPGIVIPALTGILNEPNKNEFLAITASQASWMGCIGYFIQPFGSMISTLTTDMLGRKRSMLFVNIIFALGWYMLYQAKHIWEVFFGMAVLGLAIGLREAAVIAYISEICEPSTRGIMNAFSNVMETLGMLVIYILNTLVPWRIACLLCLSLPIASGLMLCFIPETPQWLLSRNRLRHAEKSLMWLRGWVPGHLVAEEFNELQSHSERSKSCDSCIKEDLQCSHAASSLTEKFALLKCKSTLKPFLIIIALSSMSQFSGVNGMRPFIIQIFKAYESPIEPSIAATLISIVDNFGIVAFMCLVCFTGKRKLYLIMATGVFFSALVTAGYGLFFLPNGTVSFDQTLRSVQLENQNSLAYIPLLGLITWSFFSYCSVLSMPWVVMAEIFSFKTRGMMVGISAAVSYALGFIARKTYYNLETTLSLPGVSLLYCIIAGTGLVLMYFIFPETENRTLEDIEVHFADDSKSIFNHKITKMRVSNRIENAKDKENLIKH